MHTVTYGVQVHAHYSFERSVSARAPRSGRKRKYYFKERILHLGKLMSVNEGLER